MTLQVGISTCPNDTFAFHGILTGAVSSLDLDLEIELLDIQQLNIRLSDGTLDVSKASFHAALHIAEDYQILPVGAALGFGVGPIIVAREGAYSPSTFDWSTCRALCPGAWTTASLLMQLFHPDVPYLENRIFSEIVPALRKGESDLGVLIHEGRFTYESEGLILVEDLGLTWEQETKLPLPLGGLVARRGLPPEQLKSFVQLVRDSIEYGFQHRDEALITMQRYAQELNPDVLWKHVELYVNDYTVDLGGVGIRSLSVLADKARNMGLLNSSEESLLIASAG